jgi:hypothetical protein
MNRAVEWPESTSQRASCASSGIAEMIQNDMIIASLPFIFSMPFLFFKLRFGCHLTVERRVADLMNTCIDRCHGTSRRLVNCTRTSKEKKLRQNGFWSLLSTGSREAVCLLWANQRRDPNGRWQALNLFRQRADAESQPIGRALRAKQRCTSHGRDCGRKPQGR